MLRGKAAIVTGSTSGIGLGIARALAEAGCKIMLNGFGDPLAIEQERKRIVRDFGVETHFDSADLSKPAEVQQLVESSTRELGGVDILVNNAGIQHTAPIEDFPPERWDAVIAINLSAAFHATRAVIPQMRKRNWGRIINIASAHGLVASAEKAAYVASKHGILGLTKVVALETATTAITCNAVCPGDVSTRIFYRNAKLLAEREQITRTEAQQRIASTNMPSGRVVAPEQVAALVAFLCSEAAVEIRGAAFPIDGAWLAR